MPLRSQWQTAGAIDECDVTELDEREFVESYVRRNRPLHIRGAVREWRAFREWQGLEGVARAFADKPARPRRTPAVECFSLRDPVPEARFLAIRESGVGQPIPMADFLAEVSQANSEMLFCEFPGNKPEQRDLEPALRAARRRLPFLASPPIPRFYPKWTAVLFRRSYSDWHFHHSTEAVMCQLKAPKDLLLLPPTRAVWRRIVPVHRGQGSFHQLDLSTNPRLAQLRPVHVSVEPGDGVYIPINWWHAVEACSDEWGVTVPVWWEAENQPLTHPATWQLMHLAWRQWGWRSGVHISRVVIERNLRALLRRRTPAPVIEAACSEVPTPRSRSTAGRAG